MISLVGIVGFAGTLLLFLTQNTSRPNLETLSETRPIKIACSEPWVGYFPLVLAADKFFKQNNASAELIFVENQTKTGELYLNGLVDGICSFLADTIYYDSRGFESKLVYVFDHSTTSDVIVSKENNITDLKGKRIGVEGINTWSHLFVLQALEQAGLSEKDVQFVDILSQDILEALDNKQIDAGHTYGPTKFAGIQSGYNILATAQDVPAIIADVLIFNSKVDEARPDDIQAVVSSVVEGREYVDNNREESLAILSDFYNITEEEIQDGLKGINLLNLNDNIKAMQKSNDTISMYRSGKIIGDFYLQNGQIRETPNYDDIITSKYLSNLSSQS